MTQTLALHAATPRDYVQQLNLRHALSPHVYRSILNQFYRFTIKRAKDGRVSEKVVREWLKDNEPDTYSRSRYFLEPKDWLNLRLTGRAAATYDSKRGVVPLQAIWTP